MAEDISPERMQRLMELSNNAMTVELGALRNPQVTTVPSNEPNAFYQTAPSYERAVNDLLYVQYRIIDNASDYLKFPSNTPAEIESLKEEVKTAEKQIERIKSTPENVIVAYVNRLQQENVQSVKDEMYGNFSELDQARDQIVISEGATDSVLAHEIGHGAFSAAKDFFLQKVAELGSKEAAFVAVSLEYGRDVAENIRSVLDQAAAIGFADENEGTVQYYDNPLSDDPENPGVGTATFEGGETYYTPGGGFQGPYDLPRPVSTDLLLQKPFTDYRTGELVYHDEYKGGTEQHDEGDFETDLKKAGLMGFEAVMSDLISEKKGLDRFAERQRRGLKINPLGAPEGEVLRSVRPKFRPENFAQGGPVRRGIGTLNETARNMFRGPSGVGAYQQFADGGEADMSEAELKRLEALYGGSVFNDFDIPVDGKVNFRTTEDGRQMFDAEIAKTFDGERGNITPSARYSTQSGSRSMGDVVIDDEGRQIGFAIEGELYLDPDSENKLRGAIDIENSRQKRSFTFPDGEFVETKDGVLKKFNLGFDFGRLGVNFDHVEPSGQPNRTSGSATIRIGENGIFRYQDSQGKEPEYSFNYNTDVGDGTGSLNYQEDGRNDPKLGMGYTTQMGEGVGSFSYNTDGQDNELGVKYTTNFASGGEAMGPPPTRGPDPQGIGAFQKFADGGPVYMQEGGTGRDALASNHFDLIKEKYPSVDPLKISQEEGLPPQLISVFQRLLFQENQSADAGAVGTSGEIGLAQLMPVTAKDVGVNRDNLIDNVRGGARYLFKMYNRFDQDPMKAVAAYNAGPTAVVDNLDRNDGQLNIGQLPSTTQSYLGFVVQPVLNQTEVAQTIDPMMAGEDLAMSMPVAQSDYLSPEAQENIRQGTQFQGGSPTGDLSIGEQIRREKFKPNVSFEGQEMEAMPVALRDKYSSKNMQEQLVGGQEPLDKGIAGLTRSLRPPLRPEEGLTRSLRPPFRPEEEEMREPQDRYPGTNTDIGEGFGIYI